jgi:glycosyltransferase involved in cell wall biosynthesis
LYAGRLTAEKGVHVLLAAWQQVVRGYMRDDVFLQIAGSGDPTYEETLRIQVRKAGMGDSVEFLGRVPEEEMPALYRRQDVLVVPSTWPEPFARVLLEGMAAGLAVVATTVGGNSEAIRHQRDGLLVRPGDSMDLAFKLLRLADHPEERQQLGEQGRQRVLEAFTEELMLDQIEAMLRQVVWGKVAGNGHYAAAHT